MYLRKSSVTDVLLFAGCSPLGRHATWLRPPECSSVDSQSQTSTSTSCNAFRTCWRNANQKNVVKVKDNLWNGREQLGELLKLEQFTAVYYLPDWWHVISVWLIGKRFYVTNYKQFTNLDPNHVSLETNLRPNIRGYGNWQMFNYNIAKCIYWRSRILQVFAMHINLNEAYTDFVIKYDETNFKSLYWSHC